MIGVSKKVFLFGFICLLFLLSNVAFSLDSFDIGELTAMSDDEQIEVSVRYLNLVSEIRIGINIETEENKISIMLDDDMRAQMVSNLVKFTNWNRINEEYDELLTKNIGGLFVAFGWVNNSTEKLCVADFVLLTMDFKSLSLGDNRFLLSYDRIDDQMNSYSYYYLSSKKIYFNEEESIELLNLLLDETIEDAILEETQRLNDLNNRYE